MEYTSSNISDIYTETRPHKKHVTPDKIKALFIFSVYKLCVVGPAGRQSGTTEPVL